MSGAALTYRIDPEAGIIDLVGPDGLNPDAFVRTLDEVLQDDDYRPDFAFFRDRRGFSMPPTGLVRGVATFIKERQNLRGSRWAVVVSDPGNYGMMRMLEMLGDMTELRIFPDPDAARSWLVDPSSDPAGSGP
jgi:hypothetical protein